jgi:hypothetical protein
MKGLPDAIEFALRVQASLSGPKIKDIEWTGPTDAIRKDQAFGQAITGKVHGVMINPPTYPCRSDRSDTFEDAVNKARYKDYLSRLSTFYCESGADPSEM